MLIDLETDPGKMKDVAGVTAQRFVNPVVAVVVQGGDPLDYNSCEHIPPCMLYTSLRPADSHLFVDRSVALARYASPFNPPVGGGSMEFNGRNVSGWPAPLRRAVDSIAEQGRQRLTRSAWKGKDARKRCGGGG
jgi:hypothetical protein